MKKTVLIIGIVALSAACKNSVTSNSSESNSVVSEISEATTNDDLKSISYETETIIPGGMGTTNSKVIFDDYGKKSRTEMTTTMSLGGKSMNTSYNSLMVDGYVYSWSNLAKTGNKFKLDASNFDPANTDFSKLTDEMRKKLNYKDLGTETVNGKDCKVASFTTEQMQGKIWMWKQVPVKMEMSMMGKVITTNVKDINENPNIPAGIFDVPSDIQFKEMNIGKPTVEK